MVMLIHILNVLGVTNLSGRWYGWWSGAGSDIGEVAIIGGLITVVRRHNCEVHRCWRVGRHHTAAGHAVCRVHSPDGAPTHDDVIAAHRAAVRRSP
jgi:hypothetical protein